MTAPVYLPDDLGSAGMTCGEFGISHKTALSL
jgi:hypothetical protein